MWQTKDVRAASSRTATTTNSGVLSASLNQ